MIPIRANPDPVYSPSPATTVRSKLIASVLASSSVAWSTNWVSAPQNVSGCDIANSSDPVPWVAPTVSGATAGSGNPFGPNPLAPSSNEYNSVAGGAGRR